MKIRILVASLLVSSHASFGADQSNGCGLGWQVSSKNSLLSSAIRNTTNNFLPNTLSMTSGTSGCASHTVVKNDEEAVIYAVNNYQVLVAEMALGQGEFLDGFASTLGCRDALRSGFGELLQNNYAELRKEAANADGVSLYRAVRTLLLRSPGFGEHCSPSAII